MSSPTPTPDTVALQKLIDDSNILVEGYNSLKAINATLVAHVATQPAETQKAIADALAANEKVNADKISAADAAIENIINSPTPTPGPSS